MTLDFERAALYPPAARSKVQRVAQSVRHIHGVQSLSLPIGGVVVVCLVKDGEYYVRAFIEHYLRIGAIHIVLLDNINQSAFLRRIFNTALFHAQFINSPNQIIHGRPVFTMVASGNTLQ